MPLQATSGAASYDAFGGGVPVEPNYIESVFSTYLYAGNSTNRSIVNDIDLSGKGGLVWIKDRNFGLNHTLFDTARGATKFLSSDNTNAEGSASNTLTAFNSNGFNLGTNSGYVNGSGYNYVSWTFRKQPKFFTQGTYTGTGSAQTIAHDLGSTPGFIVIKGMDNSYAWVCYHRSLGATQWTALSSTQQAFTNSTIFNNTEPTSTTFTVGTSNAVSESGKPFVYYMFSHNAGGFGLTGTDNVISCGSYTGTGGAGNNVTLGYEPQWVMIKNATSANDWVMFDTMRGMTVGAGDAFLLANTSDAESTGANRIVPSATGFELENSSSATNTGGNTYIYIAIRRGPMKVPTSGTSVFAVSTASGEPAYSPLFTAGFSDMTLHSPRVSESGNGHLITDRLRGNGVILETPYTNAENTISTYFKYDSNDGAYIPNIGYFNNTGGTSKPYALRAFRRAPSFFDEVCYTGTGSATTFTHNLGVAPQLMIIKRRSASSFNGWPVYVPTSTAPRTNVCLLNTTASAADSSYFNLTAPTSTVFSVDDHQDVNASGNTYVAYLFATCAGVSKVGRYTGNGSTQTINCGFTGGARFVLIKRTDSTGDWMVSDSARGIVSGNDPYLELNNTNAEVTGEDWLDTDSTGFVVNEVSGSNANTSSATYIFLAIA